MKRTTILCWALLLAGIATCPAQTQRTTSDFQPAQRPAALPEYLYCEIIAEAEPTFAESAVVFDFGQKTGAWRYNYLADAEGNAYRFNSGIEALNYMVCRGWEFVAAFTSGKDNRTKHYLLRISPTLLPEQTQQRMTEEPFRRNDAERKKRTADGSRP